MLKRIKETTDYLASIINFVPEVGIVLGSGLGGLAQEINVAKSFKYDEIPNFPVSTVEGHGNYLLAGELYGKKVIAMCGRFHYYEGHSFQEITFPIRVMKEMGVNKLFLSNASGGLNPEYEIGDLMVIEDHINMLPGNPLVGPNMDELGPRFVDMSAAYDREMIEEALNLAQEINLDLKKGIYLATSGPNFETPAEYRLFRSFGADVVGMSTVPEVLVARHMGLPCFAISVITDLGVPGKIVEISHTEVLRVAQRAEKRMTQIFKFMIAQMP